MRDVEVYEDDAKKLGLTQAPSLVVYGDKTVIYGGIGKIKEFIDSRNEATPKIITDTASVLHKLQILTIKGNSSQIDERKIIKWELNYGWQFSVFCILLAFLSQTGYAYSVQSPSALRNVDIEMLAAQPRFDSREYGIITPVRDQGNTSLCWAYSTASASETSVLRKGIDAAVTAKSVFLSPQQIGYARHNRGADPLGNTSGERTPQSGEWEIFGQRNKVCRRTAFNLVRPG